MDKFDMSQCISEVIYKQAYSEADCMYGDDVCFNSKHIAKAFEISKYKALKVIKRMVEDELIKKVSIGRPAIVSGYEYEELVSDAMPPVNGYRLTEKGRQTQIAISAREKAEKVFREWANSFDKE